MKWTNFSDTSVRPCCRSRPRIHADYAYQIILIRILKVSDIDFVFWLVISISLSEDVIKLTLIFVFGLMIRIVFWTEIFHSTLIDQLEKWWHYPKCWHHYWWQNIFEILINNRHLWKWTVGDNEIGFLPKITKGWKI